MPPQGFPFPPARGNLNDKVTDAISKYIQFENFLKPYFQRSKNILISKAVIIHYYSNGDISSVDSLIISESESQM